MKTSSRFILQLGLAITFFVVGCMILQDPLAWGSFISPWALKLIPGSLKDTMITTAYLDMAVGILFLFRPTAWIAGFIGAIHLVVVLVTTGLDSATVTIRDVGLLAGCIAIFIETLPAMITNRFSRK